MVDWESNASNVSPHPTHQLRFKIVPSFFGHFMIVNLFVLDYLLLYLVYVLQVAAVSKCWQGSALTSDTYSLIFPEISPASCTCSTVPAKSLLASSVSKPRLS